MNEFEKMTNKDRAKFKPSEEFETLTQKFFKSLFGLRITTSQRRKLVTDTADLLEKAFIEGYEDGVKTSVETMKMLQENNIIVDFSEKKHDA